MTDALCDRHTDHADMKPSDALLSRLQVWVRRLDQGVIRNSTTRERITADLRETIEIINELLDERDEHNRIQPASMTDDEIRSAWRQAGGEFHGPKIEHGSIREVDLFAFVRNWRSAPSATVPAVDVAQLNRELCVREGHVLGIPVRECLRCHVQFAHEAVIEACDAGHKFAKLSDHPLRDGWPRCPHCMAIGLDAERASTKATCNECYGVGRLAVFADGVRVADMPCPLGCSTRDPDQPMVTEPHCPVHGYISAGTPKSECICNPPGITLVDSLANSSVRLPGDGMPAPADVTIPGPSWSSAKITGRGGMWIYGPNTPSRYHSSDRIAQGMLDALTKAALEWWKENQGELHPNGVNWDNQYGPDRTPEFVKMAVLIAGAKPEDHGIRDPLCPVIDINTGEFTIREQDTDADDDEPSVSNPVLIPGARMPGGEPMFSLDPADGAESGFQVTVTSPLKPVAARPGDIATCPSCLYVFQMMTAPKFANQCLQNAGDDEPIFVLRAQDLLAPQVIRHWAELAGGRKGAQAIDVANEMERWPNRKVPD